ncbi:unnamed protein product, partial [Prorocentrum cordatum]
MAAGVPRAKGAVRQDWTCKSCANKRGRAVVNWGTALKCQGCRLPTATCFWASVPVPAAAKSNTKSGAAPGGGSGKAPPWAGPPLAVQLAQARRELADLKKQLKAGGPACAGGPFGGAQAMEVDDGEGAGAGDAAVLAEIHMCELGLRAIKDQTADWATAPREELRARLETAKARLFASKPLHARTHAIANRATQGAERLEKAEGNTRKAQAALRRAVEEVERAEKVHADLLEQQAALQAELAQLQQQAPQAPPPRPAVQAMAQDVIGGLGIAVGELEAQKRVAAVLGERIAELCMSKRARREEAPAEEQASASQGPASAAGVVREGAGRGGRSQPAPEAAAPGSGGGSAAVPRWQPEEESVELLQQQLRKHGLELDGGEESAVRARCAALASGGIGLARILLFLSTWFGAMAKGSIFAADVAAGGSLARCAEGICERAEAVALLVQEHRARDHDRLATLQQAALDHGCAGLWAPAVQGPRGESPVLLAARLAAARVRWGVAGGFVAISAYFHDSVGWNADNQHVAAVLMKYLAKLSAAGIDWIVGGDFNVEPAKFPAQQLHGVRGSWAAAEDATCRPRDGAWPTLGDFLFAANLAPRLGRPQVDECACPSQWSGARSRGVEDWRGPLAKVRAAVSREHLPEAWGAVVATVELELLDCRDVVGHDRAKYVGRSGDLQTTIAGSAPDGVGACVAKAVHQLRGAGLLCPLFDAQFDVLTGFLLEAAACLDEIISSRGALALLPHWVQVFFGQRMLMFARADFAGQVWRCHGLQQPRRPAGTEEWDALPGLTVDKMKRAALSFPASTAMGPAKIGMRALSCLSEDGMYVCAQLFMRIEKLGAWARADISKGWLAQHPSVDIWGLGAGRSSSDAAFDLNLETEVAVALEEQVVTVFPVAWKFYQTVIPEALIQEARLLKMPLPLVWLLVELRRQPGRLQAFVSASYEVVSYRGVLAGRARACALVSVLMCRVLGRARCAGLTPRALVDDVTLQWVRAAGSDVSVAWAAVTRFREEAKHLGIIVQPAKSGYVTSSKGLGAESRKHAGSRGLQLLHWTRNLGHDLGGGRIQRLQAKLRLKAPARRRGRLAALKRAAGRKVAVLWRPSGATIYLATLRSARFDPVYEATVALVVRYSSWIWEQRTLLGRLQRAWASITLRLVEKPTWGMARGLVASTTLALWGIGWFMWSTLVLVTDEEQHINMLATSPSDLKAEALGHRLYDCEALLCASSEEQDVLPHRLQQTWATMRDTGLQAGAVDVADFSGFAPEVGLPVLPPRAPPAADEAEVAELLEQQARFVATDLLALAQGASCWGPELERTQAVRATVWKHLRQQPCRPEVHTEFYAIEVGYFKQVADCIGWAMQRCLAIGDWAPVVRYAPAAPPPPAPKLTVAEHSLVRAQGKRGAPCVERGRRSHAEAGAAAPQFIGSSCMPTPLARLEAAAEVAHFGAGPCWMGDAEVLEAEALQPCDGGRPCKLAQRPNPWVHEGDACGVVLHVGHRLRRAGPTIFCGVCVAWMQGCRLRTCVSNLAARRDRTDEAVVAQGSVEAPLADAQGAATRGSPASPRGGRTEEARLADAQETATRGAPAVLRGGRAVEAPLAGGQSTATLGAPVPPRGGRTEASRLLAEVAARRSACAAPAPSWQERLEVLRRRVAAREAGLARGAAGGAGSVPKAQGCAVGGRAVSWAVRRQALLRRLRARAERLCGGAGAPPRAAPAGLAARLRRRGIRVARPPPRAALPQRPPRPLAPERRLDRWGPRWTEPLLDAGSAASDWLDHCAPYVEAVFDQPRWRRFPRAMGSAARQLAEAWCRRAWSRGARLRGACARYRSGLTLSQRCVTGGVRRCEVYCLRSWLAAPAGLPPALGWARAMRRRPRPGAAAAPRESQGRLGAQADSQGHSGGEGSDAGEGVAPVDNTNRLELSPPFLGEVFANGGNVGLERLLSGHRTLQQAHARRQLACQLQQPDCGRCNEEGEAKERQQNLLATLGRIAKGALVGPATCHQVAEEVRGAANYLTKAVKRAHTHWVHDAAAGSAKMAHAYTEAAERSHIEDILEHEGQVVSHPQRLVDLRKGAWQRIWTRDARKADQIQGALGKLRTAALEQENALEPLGKDVVGSAIQHLRRNAGQGADWWRAPELKAMGAQGLMDFAQCLRNCEERAAWPWQFHLVLELLLGKKPGIGGERPIGLMPMPYRIWSAARRPIIATWSKEAAGFWDTAVAGSSALRVATHRLMRAEAAVQMGFHAAGTFYDAANFFDDIGLDQLIEKASDLNYPLLPLAMAAQMYLAPRAIMAHSLFSDIFEPANSMAAGCGQAVDLTRPLLYDILEAAHANYIYVVIQQYLDDLALQIEGARKQVIEQVRYVAALVHQGFARLSIPISFKTAVVASDKDLQQEIATILDGLGTPNKQPGVVRDLGVDTGLGKQLKRPTHAARQAKAKQRIEKLKDLAKSDARGAAKVYAAGAYCQQAWDLPAHGVTPTEAIMVRAAEAALLTGGHKAGRCTAAILLIQRGAQEAVTRAIVDQVKQFWLTIVDHPSELKRYQRGWHLLYGKLHALEPNRRWDQVKGPMAGVIVQLLGLGLKEGGDLYQLQRHLRRRRRKGQHAEAAMLETIAAAGIWTRERRRAADPNQEGEDTCARCGAASETEKHRYYACPANEEIGYSNDTELVKKAKDALDQQQDEHFWLRGIPPAARAVKVDPDEDVKKAAHIFCTSAAAQAAVQRCGQDGLPQEVAAWRGTIRAPHTVPRAELTAMSMAIGYTTAASVWGLNIASDCKFALDALKQIQDPDDLDYRSTNFDLWPMAKRQLQNSTDHIMGHHIPSHMIEHPAELERWTGPAWWVIGNEMADTCAGWGAEHGALDPAIIAQQQIRDQITVSVQNRLLGISMVVMVEDPNKVAQRSKTKRKRLDFKTVQIGTRVVHDTHKTQLAQGWLWCEKCGATSYLGNHKSRIVAGVARKLAKPCVPPTAAGRRVIMDLQKGRLPRRATHDEDQAAAAPPEEVKAAGFNPKVSSAEVIDLDGESSEAEAPRQAQPPTPRHPHPAAQASWQLVDHMAGCAEQWMNMVDQDAWEDKDDWMEHSVPYLQAATTRS